MLTKHHERKMPKNRGHIASLARSYTDTAIKTLAGIMMEQTSPPMARIAAAKVLLDRGWGKPKEMHHSEVDGNKTLLKVVNEIVHVYETREQIEFNDQTPLLSTRAKMAAIITNGLSAKGWGSRAARPPSLPHRQGRQDRIRRGAYALGRRRLGRPPMITSSSIHSSR